MIVAILLIIATLVIQFNSFRKALIVLVPIPLALIGVFVGMAIFDVSLGLPGLIGILALFGIVVKNSIILVDFIEHQLGTGMNLLEAVVSAGVLRFRPMLLTAAAVVVGSAVMLFDPIFQGLAVSLMFGEVAATILSRVAVPVLYYWFVGGSRIKEIQSDKQEEVHVH
jgi:multidrug efflux pump subunit AcrB